MVLPVWQSSDASVARVPVDSSSLNCDRSHCGGVFFCQCPSDYTTSWTKSSLACGSVIFRVPSMERPSRPRRSSASSPQCEERSPSTQCAASLFPEQLLISPQTFNKCQINIDDSADEDVLVHFLPSISFIQKELDKGRGVLVHCQAGLSESSP